MERAMLGTLYLDRQLIVEGYPSETLARRQRPAISLASSSERRHTIHHSRLYSVARWSAHDVRRSRAVGRGLYSTRIFYGHPRQGLQAGAAGKAGLPPCDTPRQEGSRGGRATATCPPCHPLNPAVPRWTMPCGVHHSTPSDDTHPGFYACSSCPAQCDHCADTTAGRGLGDTAAGGLSHGL